MISRTSISIFLVVFALPTLAEEARPKADGPLAKYVNADDDSFAWKVRRRGKIGVTDFAELTLVSQTWHDVVWKHQLFVIKPSTTKKSVDHGLLVIEGGSWHDRLEEPAGEADRLPREAPVFAAIAENLAVPVAVLLQVPHQPILGGRYEDDAIAQTFENFLKTGDETWPLLLPMTKAAVRGMDATQAFAKKEWELDVERFTVTGASKRGWTSWLTGAVDPRCTAIAPMVIDMLNMAPQMKHQVDSWGKFSDSIRDYTRRGLHEHLQTDAGAKLRAIVDPYSYREVVTQPKLIILGTNDQYWPLDAQNFYWDDLKGEKYLLNIPNNRHGLTDYARLIGTITALDRHTNGGPKLPKLDWAFAKTDKGTQATLKVSEKPKRVRAWVATSEDRDFRPDRWTAHEVETDAASEYVYTLAQPEHGYAAFFMEASFHGDPLSYYLTTQIKVTSAEVK